MPSLASVKVRTLLRKTDGMSDPTPPPPGGRGLTFQMTLRWFEISVTVTYFSNIHTICTINTLYRVESVRGPVFVGEVIRITLSKRTSLFQCPLHELSGTTSEYLNEAVAHSLICFPKHVFQFPGDARKEALCFKWRQHFSRRRISNLCGVFFDI